MVLVFELLKLAIATRFCYLFSAGLYPAFYCQGPLLQEKSYCGPHAFLPKLNTK